MNNNVSQKHHFTKEEFLDKVKQFFLLIDDLTSRSAIGREIEYLNKYKKLVELNMLMYDEHSNGNIRNYNVTFEEFKNVILVNIDCFIIKYNEDEGYGISFEDRQNYDNSFDISVDNNNIITSFFLVDEAMYYILTELGLCMNFLLDGGNLEWDAMY